MAKNTKVLRGVSKKHKVNIQARRDDVRTFWQRLDDRCSTPSGTLRVFLVLAGVALLLSWAPFLPEFILCVALFVYVRCYSLKNRKWEGPFRLPARLNKIMGREIVDSSTKKAAEGNIFAGMDEETGQQVWVSSNDINTHSLIIGTTRSGKTEEMMGKSFGLLALGSGVLIVDGKASVNTYDSLYKISRLLGREEDLLVIDYLTGGRDIQGPQKHKRSHGYNPLGFGGSSQMSETMVSLMDTGDGADMWAGRAIAFMEAIMAPLAFLSDRGHILLNPSVLADYFLLSNIENLCWFGVFQDLNGKFVDLQSDHPQDWIALHQRLDALRRYLENLPSYPMSKPTKPVRHARMDADTFQRLEASYGNAGRAEDDKGQKGEQSRQKVEEQHGYITMQLVRAVVNLSFNYGYIYNNEISEISFRDVVLNRRSLVVLLPAMEKSPENLEQLGKLTILSLKSVLGSLLEADAEGRKREIMDASPSRSKIPFSAVLDEIGYYIVKGLSVIPAQARSLGVAVTFGTQDIPSLMKASEAEGKAILDNTSIKLFGRLTSAQDSDTARVAVDIGGKVHVQTSKDMDFRADAVASRLKLGTGSSLEEVSQIDYQDLVHQENGQFHMVTGTKNIDRRGREIGGARVIRMLAFYTGGIPSVEHWRRNPFAPVKPISPSDGLQIRQQELIRREAKIGERRTQEALAAGGGDLGKLTEKVGNDIVARAVARARRGDLTLDDVKDYVRRELDTARAKHQANVRSEHERAFRRCLADLHAGMNDEADFAERSSERIVRDLLSQPLPAAAPRLVREQVIDLMDAM